MDSCIFIDGPVLWCVMVIIGIFVLFGILSALIAACAQRENNGLKRENAYLRKKLSRTQDKLYQAQFTLPEVEDV